MACKKIILNGPFYLRNKDNRKYPPGNISDNCQFGVEYLKRTFWKNEDFMSRLDDIYDGGEIESIVRQKIGSLGMNTENFQRYNFDINAMENIPKEDAIEILIHLVKKNSTERKSKKKKLSHKKGTNKHKLENTTSSLSNKKVSMVHSKTTSTCKNVDISSKKVPLLYNIYDDICMQNVCSDQNILYDKMLPFNIDPDHSPKASFETKCEQYEMYSMIHNVFEDFNFCVYNGSHKSSGQTIHRSSMTNLYFPSDVGMFVLFHGALVHSGAASKTEKDINSFNYSADVRFHSYIQRRSYVHDETSTSSIRRSGRRSALSKYRNHSTDVTASSSIKHCSNVEEVVKNTQRKFLCKICEQTLRELKTRYPIVNNNVCINMSTLYKKALESKKTHEKNKPMYIAGDLEKYGWVVYTGYQTCKLRTKEKEQLRDELMNFIHSSSAKDWRMPQKNRFVRTIDNNPQSLGNINKITEFYDHMLKDCLRQIPLFDKAVMTERYIIRNGGLALEQKPHRDFEYSVHNK